MQHPAFPEQQLAQAVALQNRGDLVGAQHLYWQILLDQPAQFDALHLLGVSKCQQGQQAEGAWFIARALEQRPDDASAWFNHAMAMAELHRHDQAIAGFDRATALRPHHAPAWSSRGDALQTIGRHAEAIESYHRAIGLAPGMAGTLSNLGNALLATGHASAATEAFQRALANGADPATAYTGIGRAQQELGNAAAARDALQSAAVLAGAVQARWLLALSTLPDIAASTAEIDAARPAFRAALDALEHWFAQNPDADRLEHAWPFFLAYQDRDNRDLLARFGRLRAQLMDEWRQRHAVKLDPPPGQARSGPLRVAVVSPHLYSHSVWHAITRGWFAGHDPARIALHGFHIGTRRDEETAFAQARAASFTFGERPLAEWIRAIQAVHPDVVVYPAIGMDVTGGNLAALRLAPVQVTTWGHPETSGLPTIDAYLSADALEPPDHDINADAPYTEHLVRLPGLGVDIAAQPPHVTAPDLAALGIDPARPLILCPGTPFKYAPENDAVLAAIAHAVPTVQIGFFHAKTGTPQSVRLQQRIAAHFADAGLDARQHCRLLPFQPAAAFQGLLARADACLDSIGFSGFNTALQALSCGAVVVGFEGRFMRGRLASGLLRQMGLDALVATDRPGFAAIAVRLATDAAFGCDMRARIAAALPALYEHSASTGSWMDALEKLVQQSTERRQYNPTKV